MEAPGKSTSLRLLQGGGSEPPTVKSPWQLLPQIVTGRHPLFKDRLVGFRLSQSSIVKSLQMGRRQPLFDAMSMVVGRAPNVPNISRWSGPDTGVPLTPLAKAHACFRGMKRPIGEDDRGFDTFAFVTKPQWAYKACVSLVCAVEPYRVPNDVVFVTYVRLDHPFSAPRMTRHTDELPVKGIITHWGFVETEPGDNNLPIGAAERYRQRIW